MTWTVLCVVVLWSQGFVGVGRAVLYLLNRRYWRTLVHVSNPGAPHMYLYSVLDPLVSHKDIEAVADMVEATGELEPSSRCGVAWHGKRLLRRQATYAGNRCCTCQCAAGPSMLRVCACACVCCVCVCGCGCTVFQVAKSPASCLHSLATWTTF